MLGKKKPYQGPTPFEIGKNGTVEQLLQANETALGKGDIAVQQSSLREGALAAFQEGRPENLQTILSCPQEFSIGHYGARNIFYILIKGKDDPVAVIKLALDKVPAPEQQEILDEALYAAVDCDSYERDKDLISALLQMGADTNIERNGLPGLVMALAITNAFHPDIIKLLYDNGASFKDAENRINIRTYWDKDNLRATSIGRLKTYREQITGEPATDESKIAEMQKTIDLLVEGYADLSKRLDEALSAKPAPQKEPVRAAHAKAAKNNAAAPAIIRTRTSGKAKIPTL